MVLTTFGSECHYMAVNVVTYTTKFIATITLQKTVSIVADINSDLHYIYGNIYYFDFTVYISIYNVWKVRWSSAFIY